MNIIEYIKSSIFPNRCPFCNKPISPEEFYCEKCAKTFPDFPIKSCAKGGVMCISSFFYKDNFSKAVKNLKFNGYRQFAKNLSYLLAQTITKYATEQNFDCITYVPIHKERFKQRGYNQAQLLAKHTSDFLNLPLEDLLIKHKNNKPQHSCPAKERAINVKGVYKATDKSLIKDKNILIIDDIITSGHTLGECAKVLYKNGAKNVYCATICSRNIM